MSRALCLTLALALLPVAACDSGDDTPTPGASSWQLAFHQLPAAMLSVWGTSDHDVFIVGSDLKGGKGPLVYHWDGSAMTRLPTGQSAGDLWWVSGTDAASPVYLSGSGGVALRYDRGGAFTPLTGVPATVTLFGIAPVGGDVWAVGGDAGDNTGHAYKLAGTAFAEDTTLPSEATSSGQFFKVWGRSATDLWVVGLGTKAMHEDGAGWHVFDVPQEGSLFTVHGNATETIAVGGSIDGLAVSLDASGVTEITPDGAEQLNGVWVEPGGDVVAVGTVGSVWTRHGTAWTEDTDAPPVSDDYHSVFVDPSGGIWAVGGFILSEPLHDGMLSHFGPTALPTAVPE